MLSRGSEMLTRWPPVVAITLASMASIVAFAAPVFAADSGRVDLSITGGGASRGDGATVSVGASHSQTTAGSGGGGAGSTSVGANRATTRTCSFNGSAIDCTSSEGVWSNERQCWVRRLSPQPDLGATAWEGRTDGAIYQCTPPGASFSAGQGRGYWFWAPDAGEAGAPALVDPVVLAERAVEQMALAAPTVGMTPLDRSAPLLVGMDAWMWLSDPGPRVVGPITRTATAGPTSVTATARVTSVDWDMGDGSTVTCPGAGTEWTPARGTGPSPTCGHRYLRASATRPGGAYTVRATAHWQVDWRGAGQSGRMSFALSGSRPLRVVEIQVLQTG